MKIFKTFESVMKLPTKLFTGNNLQIMHVETDNKTDVATQAQISDKNIYFTVYNNKKVYNLLTSVLYKKKMLNENKDSKIFNQCSFN